MWKNKDTFEMINDTEMERIIKKYNCHVTNFGKRVIANGEVWDYMEEKKDVLFY